MNTKAERRDTTRGVAVLLAVIVVLAVWVLPRTRLKPDEAGTPTHPAAEIKRRGGTFDYSEDILPAVEFQNADDEALTYVLSLGGISSLDLRGARITDSGLERLRELPLIDQLEILDLANTNISEYGLVHLRPLSKLRSLDLSGTRISGTDLNVLVDLSELRILHLNEVDIDGEAIAGLGRLTQIEFLFLRGIQPRYAAAADERRVRFKQAVLHLSSLVNLRFLDLRLNNLSEAEAEELRDALPNCNIRT